MSGFLQQFSVSQDGPQGAGKQKVEDQDLVTLLDRTQRADLTVLISEVTELMRTALLRYFDYTTDTQPVSDETRHRDVQTRTDHLGQGGSQPSGNAENQRDVSLGERSPGFKRNAIQYYDSWRESVILRIGEVVNRPTEGRKESRTPTLTNNLPEDKETLKEVDESPEHSRAIDPPVETPLARLPAAKKLLILHSILLLLLSLKHYNALSRVLLLNIASCLKLSADDVNEDEAKVARTLLDAAVMMSADEETKRKAEQGQIARKWKVGLASVAGAALIGITGGLAAPLVAAGIGTVMGGLGLGATAAAGYLGALASSGVIVGGLFGAYGGRMTGRMMDKYAREVEDFAFIPIRGSSHKHHDEKEAAKSDHRLRVTIGISGWATEKDDVVNPWRVIAPQSEVFALRWELESLLNLGSAIETLVTSAAWTVARRELLARTIFAQVMSAVMLPLGLMQVARIVDNPFSVAKARADKAGEVLADALINKAQGERPVTLIGYSLGSRVIYSCLLHLAKRHAFGLVESAILMGSPAPSSRIAWRKMRAVVSGRLVNIYSENDAVLALLYRASSAQFGIAGVQAISDVPDVENFDVSDLISGHLRYQYLIGRILMRIGFEETDAEEIEKEEAALRIRDEEEEQERARNESQADTESLAKDMETKASIGDATAKEEEAAERKSMESFEAFEHHHQPIQMIDNDDE